jgi:long-chain fatty acid transport protein
VLQVASGLALLFSTIIAAADVETAEAGGLYINEFATVSGGTAGAGQEAYANDASTNFAFTNPAGMTRLEGSQISLGAGVLKGRTKFDPDSDTQFSGGDGGDQAGLAPLLGTHGVWDVAEDFKLGLSIFSISGASLDPDDDWAGRFQLQELELLTISINPNAAYKVNDWLSVGGGVVAMYADLNYELAAPPVNPPDGGDGQVKIDGNDWAYGYNFGGLVELSPRTRIGAIYVSKVEPKFSGDLRARPGSGGEFSAQSDLKFTFPQTARLGAYHELDDRWAILGSVGWEDWSQFDSFDITTDEGGASIDTNWKDTYHFGAGTHFRPVSDWLLQAGITYDTSPVSDRNREAMLPVDRQIRYAVGAQHELSESISVGGSFEYVDLGDAEIQSDTLRGKYQDNRLIAMSVYFNYVF